MVQVFVVNRRKEEREKNYENPNKRSLADGGGGAKFLACALSVIQEI